jgi:hypothetical protein
MVKQIIILKEGMLSKYQLLGITHYCAIQDPESVWSKIQGPESSLCSVQDPESTPFWSKI